MRKMVSRSILEFCFSLTIILTICLFKTDAINNHKPFVPLKKFFNVLSYGANPMGKVDNSKAFLKAWDDACNFDGVSVIVIPKGGVYLLNSLTFIGPCKSYRTVLQIKGVLKATINPSYFYNLPTWIGFRYVNNLVLKGGGVLDGQGEYAWKYNDCFTNSRCAALPATLRFDYVNNSRVHSLKSVNSKNAHFNLFACSNVQISRVKFLAPSNSKNTDGIRIGTSSNIHILDSFIGTGDDCVSVITNSSNIVVTNVTCGPGHGISIGSLGSNSLSEFVKGVSVRNCTFISTQNGVRIKTRPSLFKGVVSDINFSNIIMKNVFNPIIIDQLYCPGRICSEQIPASGEGIKDVTFENIIGTSNSEVAISLKCSKSVPCRNVKLINVILPYTRGKSKSICSNVQGSSYGKQEPPNCV
ncbi:hypothetical protein Leryth_010024 [Lithospermum erythrorhizon]|uniref:Polygalacturonase n=1 Tax=Lithospermum erythrorhizon TaxID=34254 RepID=A0AAV3Q2C1_LITER|nr:hypothetical protein Leryth_010024 [Lithospermum erythrorhizon]